MGESDDSEGESTNTTPTDILSVSATENSPQQVSESINRAKVIEQARIFIEKDDIKDADRKKKTAFLKTKGLTSDEIEKLIDEREKIQTQCSSTTDVSSENLENKLQSENTLINYQTSPVPPIITYPEFLTNPTLESKPLLTTSRLLALLYTASFLTASFYGTLEYIVVPMLEKLAYCRHELFSSVLPKLGILSLKLEGLVSEIPATVKSKSLKENDTDNEDKDDDSAELFHRDVGIQTSPPISPIPKDHTQLTQEPVIQQTVNLCGLYTYIKEATSTLADEANKDTELENVFADLRKYLNTLAYTSPPISNFEGIYLSNNPAAGYASRNSMNGEVDEITKVKKEIKGMKGLLLSARTFPGMKPGLPAK